MIMHTISRRAFLKSGAVAATSLAPLRIFSKLDPKDRPNIVMFLSDDHTTMFTGCYGDSKINTPNIDRLAEQGMRFENSFTTCAMCVPSRASLYTGLYPVRHGAHHNHSHMREGVKTLPYYMAELGYVTAVAGKRHVNPVSSFPVEHIRKINSDSIDKFLQANLAQPFCLMVTPSDPHGPWDKSDEYQPEDVSIPPYLVDTPSTREWMAYYYHEISRVDRTLGMVNRLLEANGLTDNTVFIYASDHGGQWPHAKWNLYDAGLNTPYIVRWPDKVKAGSTSNALISFIDFLPTCIDLAGGQPQQYLDGNSMVDVLIGASTSHHGEVYGVSSSDFNLKIRFNEYPSRSVRTETHLYIRNLSPEQQYTSHITNAPFYAPAARQYWGEWRERAQSDDNASALVNAYVQRPAEELFEIQNDPHQLHNVALDQSNQELLAHMRSKMDAWMEQQGDQGLATEAEGKKRIMMFPNYY